MELPSQFQALEMKHTEYCYDKFIRLLQDVVSSVVLIAATIPCCAELYTTMLPHHRRRQRKATVCAKNWAHRCRTCIELAQAIFKMVRYQFFLRELRSRSQLSEFRQFNRSSLHFSLLYPLASLFFQLLTASSRNTHILFNEQGPSFSQPDTLHMAPQLSRSFPRLKTLS